MAIGFSTWYIFHNPNREILIVSTTLRQSIALLERIMELIKENEVLRDIVDKKLLSSGNWCSRSNSGARIVLSQRRKIFCAPCNENIRGYHVDHVIADEVSAYKDPNVYRSYISTRVGAKSKDGKLLAISTSKSPTDLLQECKNNSEYVSSTVPIVSKKGVLAWPNRFDQKFIDFRKAELGIGNFEREYLCNPKAEVEGAIFSAEDVMHCTDVSLKCTCDTFGGDIFIGADFAVSSGPRADFDVYWVAEKTGGKCIIRDVFRDKGIPKDEKVRILQGLNTKYGNKVYSNLLDDSGIGKAVAEDLFKLGLPVEEVSFKHTNRRQMIINLISVIQGRKLVIPFNKEDPNIDTMNVLVEELLSFREEKSESTGMLMYKSNARHDDTVMALALVCKGAYDLDDYDYSEFENVGV